MSFNTDHLTLLTLGIRDDQPVDPAPQLPNGQHFRWSPRQDLGFPWYGFYLFRRESQPRRPRCLSEDLAGLRPGASRDTVLPRLHGRLSSLQPLVFSDDFIPAGTVEVDLAAGLRFDLPEGVEAASVEVRIGFRDTGPQVARTCIDFRSFDLGLGSSPRTEQGVVFEVEQPQVSPFVPVTSIESWGGSPRGLIVQLTTTITLPGPATRVDLRLTNRAALRITAVPGMNGGTRELKAGELTQSVLTLTGDAITGLTLFSESVDAALLHEICWERPGAVGASAVASGTTQVTVRALAGTTAVATAAVEGSGGQVVAASLAAAGITAVEIDAGPAALVDLCFLPSKQAVTFGWDEVPGFTYPLCLPVAHADYPCPGRPASFEEAQALAFSRVTYRAPVGWDTGFTPLHDELVALVQGGPGGGPMAGRTHGLLTGQSLSPATQSNVPTIPGLRILDLVFLASLHPAVAQMLGLYFVDGSAAPDIGYDYLLLADPTGVLGGSAASALEWLAFTADPAQVDAALVLDRRVTTHPPIAPPGPAKAYALPGASTRAVDGVLKEASGNVGLWWQLPVDPPPPQPDQPDRIVFYYPKRAFLGTGTPPGVPPPDSQYQPLPELPAILVSEPDVPATPGPRSSDWPPSTIPLYFVDGNLPEGWYSYRFAGQDLFGRVSALGPPAGWFEWDALSEHQRHVFAVELRDTIPPPPPLGVEAWALDPLDPWVLVDPPYTNWRATVAATLVGLRVRWRWTLMQHLQAPDTREFRIYYQPGRWNALLGRIENVTAAAADQSDVDLDVDLDIGDTHSAGDFAGTRLRVGNDDFAVLGSQPGPKLRLRVKNIGAHDEIRPAVGKPCTVAIPEKHKLWVDSTLNRTWARRLAAVPYDPPARTVVDPSQDSHGQPLADEKLTGPGVTVAGATAQLPPGTDVSVVQPWVDHLWLATDTGRPGKAYAIVRYDTATATVLLEAVPALAQQPTAWILGRPTREYDVFLPAPDVGAGNPFEPSLTDPAVYAQIAVSAVDDKTHTTDDAKWHGQPLGDRFGNESRLSPSATIFRVLRKQPDPPELPDLPARLYATPADYHSRSYFTFHFVKPAGPLRIHVVRALDDSLFQRDLLIRETREALDPVLHLDLFPEDWKLDPDPAARRQAAAKEVNEIAADAAYAPLSGDAWMVLALLPGNEGIGSGEGLEAAAQQHQRAALQKRDWAIRSTRTAFRATAPASFAARTRAAYDDLLDPALRVLAGLPGNEAAFTQVTLQPLAMTDTELQDRRGPDDPPTYTPDLVNLRAYMDTLPGLATNRYFYRALFVDGAQNQSGLSGPTPPVYLPKVAPPRTPVITKVVGGERQITIRWIANRELGLKEYQVYRAEIREASRDVRLMELAAVVPAKKSSPPIIEWIDPSLRAKVSFYYRVAVVDQDGNISPASAVVLGRAIDNAVPAPPSWLRSDWVQIDEQGAEHPISANPPPSGWGRAVSLAWGTAARARTLVERRLLGRSTWSAVSDWLSSKEEKGVWTVQWRDVTANPAAVNIYRLQVESEAGNLGTSYVERSVDPA